MRGKKGQEILMVIFSVVMVLIITVIILWYSGILTGLLSTSKLDIAKTQAEALALNLRSLDNNPNNFATDVVTIQLPDDFAIVLFNRGERAVIAHDACESESLAWKPERAPGKSIPAAIEPEPQCSNRPCLCLYDEGFNDKSADNQPDRHFCSTVGDIDYFVTYHTDRWEHELEAFLGEVANATVNDTTLHEWIKRDAQEIQEASEPDKVKDNLREIRDNIRSRASELAPYGVDAETLALNVHNVFMSYVNILGGNTQEYAYPSELSVEDINNYGSVFYYGKCDDDEMKVTTLYLEKVTDTSGKKTVFVAVKSPLTDERTKEVQTALLKQTIADAERTFPRKQFDQARIGYESALQLGFDGNALLPEIEYKLGYTQYQLFDYDTALATFNSIADTAIGHYQFSPYRLYSLFMIGEIYKWRIQTAETKLEKDTATRLAKETYQRIIDEYSSFGDSSKRNTAWLARHRQGIQDRLSDFPGAGAVHGSDAYLLSSFIGARNSPDLFLDEIQNVIHFDFTDSPRFQDDNSRALLLGSLAIFELAQLERNDGAFDNALALYAPLNAIENVDAYVHVLEADTKREKGFATLEDGREAYTAFAEDNLLEPLSTTYLSLLEEIESAEGITLEVIQLYVTAGLYDEALRLLNENIDSFNATEAYRMMGDIQQKLLKTTEALDAYLCEQGNKCPALDSSSEGLTNLKRAADYLIAIGGPSDLSRARQLYDRIADTCVDPLPSVQSFCTSRIAFELPRGMLAVLGGNFGAQEILADFQDYQGEERSAALYWLGRAQELSRDTETIVNTYLQVATQLTPETFGMYTIRAREEIKTTCSADPDFPHCPAPDIIANYNRLP